MQLLVGGIVFAQLTRMCPLGAQAELAETAPAVVFMSGGQGSHEPSGFEDVGGGGDCKAVGSEG